MSISRRGSGMSRGRELIPREAPRTLAEHQPAIAEHQDIGALVTHRFDALDKAVAELRELLAHLERRSRFLG